MIRGSCGRPGTSHRRGAARAKRRGIVTGGLMERADFGGRLLAVDEDLALAKYPVRDHLRVTVPAGESGSGGWPSAPVRAVVEVQRNLGGMLWRALLGG